MGLSRSQIVAVVIATLAISVVVDFSRKAAGNLRVQARVHELQEATKLVQAENDRLKGLKEFAPSGAFIEQEARQDFKMGRPGEVRAIFLTPAPTPAIAISSTTAAVLPAEGPCWQKWWGLFLDGVPPGATWSTEK